MGEDARKQGKRFPLSSDGTKDNAYGEPHAHLAGRNEAGRDPDGTPRRSGRSISWSPRPRTSYSPKLLSYDYLKPGDRIAHPHPRLFDLTTKKPMAVNETLFPKKSMVDLRVAMVAGQRAISTFLYNQRRASGPAHHPPSMPPRARRGRSWTSGAEPSSTIRKRPSRIGWTLPTNSYGCANGTDGIISGSTTPQTGQVKNQITRGEWVVRGVERVDEEQRQIWFHCAGIHPGQDPYYVHLARINFDGTSLVVLTEGDGTHTSRKGGAEGGVARSQNWRFSPDDRWLIDTYSRVDLPPVTELRRLSDGQQVCVLEEADASRLLATGWQPPERFVAKGRDGTTDIHGIIIRPSNFDPAKKYPVIEDIYAGPHGYFVPKEWGRGIRQRTLAELGFIVVQIDGMGTNWRSRAFHDVCWKNLKDAGFPDRIAWLRDAAAHHPEMDLTRVGIFGGSAGGQSALAALLHFGDFYKAAVADCGCHDNRMDKIWWNEAWMGWPIGPEYADNSNVTHAANLAGKLLLTVGELDHNVDPSSTMQVVNALIKADKDFEMLIVPGSDHGAGEHPYMVRRRMDFFVRHLLGVVSRAGRIQIPQSFKPPQ